MGKFEEMMRTTAANADESLGQGRDHTFVALPQVVPPARLQGVTKSRNSVEIPVDRVQADPDQPREEFDEESLGRLADSLKQRGQLQPIRVRWDEGRGSTSSSAASGGGGRRSGRADEHPCRGR